MPGSIGIRGHLCPVILQETDLCSLPQQAKDLLSYFSTCGGFDQEIGQPTVIGGEETAPVESVAVEKPACQEQGRAFVGFAEGLSPGDPVDEHSRCLHRIVNSLDGAQSSGEPLQVVGLLEPLVVLTDRLVEGDGQLDAGPDQ